MSTFEEYRSWLKQHDFIEAQEFDYLDSLDLIVIICANNEKTCDEIMRIIEDKYENDYLSKYPNDEMLFNDINQSDFIDYIHWRYGIPVKEEIVYRFDIFGKE